MIYSTWRLENIAQEDGMGAAGAEVHKSKKEKDARNTERKTI